MRRIIGLVVALGLVVGTVGVTSTPASAASGSVTIKKISNKKVKYNKSATVRPSVTLKGHAKLSSKKITVKKGKKTVAKKRTSVRLKAGKYTVTTTAKYRTWRKATKYVPTPTVVFPLGSLVPVTCVIEAVDVPTSVTDTGYDERCRGDFTGAVVTRGSATFDPIAQIWTLDSGTQVAGAVAQDLVGKSESKDVVAPRDLKKTVKVKKSYTKWSSLRKKSRTQHLTIKQGPKPTRAEPYANGECPSWAPIKGNGNSGIYHVPSGAYYDVTKAEDCFSTEAAAKAAGYRKSKR